MNVKANKLNLTCTNFVTPHGLDDDNHFTSAYDLAVLSDYALKNELFAKIVKTQTYTISLNEHPKVLNNTNELLGNFAGIYGVKTGFTNGANRCLVTSCKRGDLDVICVVLGCDTKKDRTQDSIKLLNYVFNNFTVVNVKDLIMANFNNWYNEHNKSFIINKGKSDFFDLYLDEDDYAFVNLAVKKSDVSKLHTNISFVSSFEAPVKSQSLIGKISFEKDNSEFFYVDILNSNTIDRKDILDYFLYIFKNYCSFFISEYKH